ncbi:hypothetical protein JEQ12_019886 [Ovis aries]|uniref:Uncharacterized protein n=1 Tax=Ovis aries TaxID=9940 RepID=A0A836CNY2_SHEEP|nr:hypothetical protein JEQ12_019886 [Ovis aries]
MAAWRVPASMLRRLRPTARPPEPPPRDGAAFRRRHNIPLCSAAWKDSSGPGPNSQGGSEEAARNPASQDLTVAERRIVDYGYVVFTQGTHLQRGQCCGSACRHCPYGQINVKDPSKKKQFNSYFMCDNFISVLHLIEPY